MLDRLFSLVVPPVCLACRRPGSDLCPACRRALPWLPAPQCPRCALPGICGGRCPATGAGFDRAWAPVAYDGPARALVLALKGGRRTAAADLMAAQLAAALVGLPERVAIVPVAAHPSRSWTRGFDHAERLARALGRRTGLPVHDCLLRLSAGPRQVGAGRRQRLAGARSDVRVRGCAPDRVLLVDDVHTTGATLRACAGALRASGTAWLGVATYARTMVDTSDAAADKCRSQG